MQSFVSCANLLPHPLRVVPEGRPEHAATHPMKRTGGRTFREIAACLIAGRVSLPTSRFQAADSSAVYLRQAGKRRRAGSAPALRKWLCLWRSTFAAREDSVSCAAGIPVQLRGARGSLGWCCLRPAFRTACRNPRSSRDHSTPASRRRRSRTRGRGILCR